VDEVGLDGLCNESEDSAGLLPASRDDGEGRLHNSDSRSTLGAEGQFSPDRGVTLGALAGIVRGFDPVDVEERPKLVSMFEEFPTHAIKTVVAAAPHAPQNRPTRSSSCRSRVALSGRSSGRVESIRKTNPSNCEGIAK
jgi:hypothetical protein